MPNQESRGGRSAYQQPDPRPQTQNSAPEPVDTGVPSPFGKGTIEDAGNHFVVPGMEPSQIYKRINGKQLNVAEAAAVAIARKYNLEMPRFQFRKRTGEGDQARYDGNTYEATVAFDEKGKLRVHIPDRGEGREGAGQGNGRGSSAPRPTGTTCVLGAITDAGNRYLIAAKGGQERPLSVYKEKNFREFSPEEIAEIINASEEADRQRHKLKDDESLPVIEFTAKNGEKYLKRVGIDLQSGTMFTFEVPDQEQRRDRSEGQNQARGQGRTAPSPDRSRSATAPLNERPAPAPEPDAGDFMEEDEDIPDHLNEGSEEESRVEAPRRGRGR